MSTEASNRAVPLRRIGITVAIVAALVVGQGVIPAGATWQSFFEPDVVSVGYAGDQADHDSREPSISSDGRYIVYRSRADNLVPGVSGNVSRVYRYDTVAMETELVSASTIPTETVGVESVRPRISSDGRHVLFWTAFAFVPEDTNGGYDFYIRDMETGGYTWIDFFGNGSALSSWPETVAFAGDASYVAFDTGGGDLLGDGKTTVSRNVWGYDLESQEATLVSTPPTSTVAATRGSRSPAISDDGRYIVFYTGNSWVPEDTNAAQYQGQDFYVRDMETGEFRWIDFKGDGSALSDYGYDIGWNTVMSADGSRFAFEAWGTAILPGDTTADRDVFSYDLASDEATLVSGPHIDDRGSRDPSITDDGRYIMFFTGQPFAAGDTNGDQDIYIKDMVTNEFMRVPVMGDGGLPGNDIDYPMISGDGMHFVFEDESDLISSDTNDRDDIYYRPVVEPTFGDGPTRLGGMSRYDTAVSVSQEAFPFGARTAVIATGENWPDALGGAALAGAVDGPVLLTRSASLTAETKLELIRLGVHNVYLLGGYGAVSPAVETELEELLPGFVWRIGGPDRYATSKAVANRVVEVLGAEYDGKACVATGMNFPDAVGAAPLGAGLGWPVLLVRPTDPFVLLPPPTDSVVLLGGEKAVGTGVEGYLEMVLGGANVDREGGANRYETSALLAQYGVDHGLRWDGVGVATGMNYPDALTGGAAIGLHRSTLLLTPSTSLHSAAAAKLDANKDVIDTVNFLGEGEAISMTVENQVKAILGL